MNGTSLYPTDWDVMGLMTDGLETLQVLALVWSHTRTAPPSVASRVCKSQTKHAVTLIANDKY